MDRLGIDIGSKTIKLVLLSGEDGSLVFSDYRRHRSQVKQSLVAALHDHIRRMEDREVEVTVTGSAGMRVAELFDVPFVQEVVALKRAVERKLPGTDVVLEMGGEDTKLVYLSGAPEQRMNTVCAGGTGGFIDMMAGVMGARPESMQRLAMGASTIYPIASRCAVFAKSDVRPLLNSGAKKEDVAASVLRAVCTQAVAGLSAGRPIEGKVALLGGPFHYTPALRDAFCAVTGISREDATIPANAHFFVAYGAAISPESSRPVLLSELEHQIKIADFSNEEGMKRLPALFSDEREYQEFRGRHAGCTIPRADVSRANDPAADNLFLGIDAGSTTMKMALVDETGALVAWQYDWNHGDVNKSLPRLLKLVYGSYQSRYAPERTLRRSCIIGYGEQYCRAAYKVDTSEVETVAHLRAARELEPDVDFLLDIGGQDIKCFYIEDGAIEDIVLNEACSSGCGSLFDSVARSVHYSKEAFTKAALFAKAPVDLGTRCSTFMDSRVKHAQKDGVEIGDISAGVCYATARNALYKVVRQPDFSKVGEHIVVQGGAFANDALLRAFELETGAQVTRPEHSELMGAWGAALLARDEWLALKEHDPKAAAAMKSTLLSREELDKLKIRTKTERCGLCGNNCKLVVTRFCEDQHDHIGRVFVTGNRCERGATSREDVRGKLDVPPNMVKLKNALIGKCDCGEQPESGVTVGIPKVLALYESYPFWKRFFNELGLRVVADAPSCEALYRLGMGHIPSEGACYPSKLVYGHCADLLRRGADLLFLPRMGQQFAREGLLGLPLDAALRECPLVESLPEMVAANFGEGELGGARILAPDFTCVAASGAGLDVHGDAREAADKVVVAELRRLLAAVGVGRSEGEVAAAFAAAREEYAGFFGKLARANAKLLSRVEAGEFPGALLVGHPYHGDPGVNHGIDELLGELGYAVFERLDYDFTARADAERADMECVDVERTGAERAGAKGAVTGASGAALGVAGGLEVASGVLPEAPRALWTPNRELFDAIEASAAHPDLQFIVCRSFGCGVDALAADAAHERLRAQGRVFAELKIDQIVDLAAVRIRLRSLAYAMRQRSGETIVHGLYEEARRAEAERRRKAEREHAEQLKRDEERKRRMREASERANPHAREIEEMGKRGYVLVVDGASERAQRSRSFFTVIIFHKAETDAVREFDDWDEVARFIDETPLMADGAAAREFVRGTTGVGFTMNQWGMPVALCDSRVKPTYSDDQMPAAVPLPGQSSTSAPASAQVEGAQDASGAGRELKPAELIEQMRAYGYEYDSRESDSRRVGSYATQVRFRGSSGVRPFATWGEVAKFVNLMSS